MKTVLVIVLVLVLVVAVGAVAFYQGANYGQAQAQSIRAEFFQTRLGATNGEADPALRAQQGQRGQGGNQASAGLAGRAATTGTVQSVQGNTVIVSGRDGSTVTVTVDAQTTIQKLVNGAIGDIKPGVNISVTSDQTGDKITARTIQFRETP